MLNQIKHHWKTFLVGLGVGLLVVPLILILNQPPAGTPITLLPPPPTITPVPLRVHVVGAVQAPGVYQLPQHSIVQEAIAAAGGPSDLADLSRLNLAGLINDGAQLVVPEIPPTRPPTPTVGPGTPIPEPAPPTPASQIPITGSTTQPPVAAGQPININTATLAELESLPRIGPSIAQRIIDYRTLHGPFTEIEQIKNVKGIGDATFTAIQDFITVR